MVITTDRYLSNKLYTHAIKWKHRYKLCCAAASKYEWIHASHIATESAEWYAEIITKKDVYRQLTNKEHIILTINAFH